MQVKCPQCNNPADVWRHKKKLVRLCDDKECLQGGLVLPAHVGRARIERKKK